MLSDLHTRRTYEEPSARRSADQRTASLCSQLYMLDADGRGREAVKATCLVWVADVLVDLASSLNDPRSANAVVDEALAVLEAVPECTEHNPGTPEPPVRLTERETVVLRELQGDLSCREIGDRLFVSVNTIKSHTRAVYRKLGVSSRGEAVRVACELRILEPGHAAVGVTAVGATAV
jgi:ATP/maltotriose-dependent transcriptional regulator MalT